MSERVPRHPKIGQIRIPLQMRKQHFPIIRLRTHRHHRSLYGNLFPNSDPNFENMAMCRVAMRSLAPRCAEAMSSFSLACKQAVPKYAYGGQGECELLATLLMSWMMMLREYRIQHRCLKTGRASPLRMLKPATTMTMLVSGGMVP